jgi:hypothetical protein
MLKKPASFVSVVRTPQRILPAFAAGFSLLVALPDRLFEHRTGIGTLALGLKYVALQEEHPNNASAIGERF